MGSRHREDNSVDTQWREEILTCPRSLLEAPRIGPALPLDWISILHARSIMHRLWKLWWKLQKKQKALSLVEMRECVGMRRFLERKNHHMICDFSDTGAKKTRSCYFSIPGAFRGTFLLQQTQKVIVPEKGWYLLCMDGYWHRMNLRGCALTVKNLTK